MELGRLSRLHDDSGKLGVAERSLDRVKVTQAFNGARDAFQSRQELLANEYKKVIENHPGTLMQQEGDIYDDTNFLQEMFEKEKTNILQSHALRNHESNDQLLKCESTKELNGKKKTNRRSESVEVNQMKNRLKTDEVKTSKITDKL